MQAVNLVNTVTGQATATLPVVPVAHVATLLNTAVVFLRHVTRGAVAYFGYVLQGVKGQGNIFAPSAQFGGMVPTSLVFTLPSIGEVIPAGSTLLTRGNTGIAKGTRTAYAALGCPSIVIYNAMLPSPPPLALVVNVALVANTMRGAKVTSAVVAAANVAIATATGAPVLVPAAVAAVATTQVAKLVTAAAAAGMPASTVGKPVVAVTGKTGAQRKLHGSSR